MRIEGISGPDLKTKFFMKVQTLRTEMYTHNIRRTDIVLTQDSGAHCYQVLASMYLEDNGVVRIWLNAAVLTELLGAPWVNQIKAQLSKANLASKFKHCLESFTKYTPEKVNTIVEELIKIVTEYETA